MKKYLFLLALAASSLTVTAQNTTKLFNGKNLDGWGVFTKSMNVSPIEEYGVKKGNIELSGTFGYIYTKEQYSNYTLSLKWRWIGEATNSGVFLHMQGDNVAWPSCYEAQLCKGKAGDVIHAGGSTSADYTADGGKKVKASINGDVEKKVGEWNQMKVVAKDNTITIYVNGKKQNVITNLSNTKGHIGLQSEGKTIQFKDVVLSH